MYVFRFLAQEPRARGPALFSFIARIPLGAMGLVLPLLALSLDMSASVAAGSLGLCRLSQAIAGPMWGRLVDRTSMTAVLTIAGSGLAGLVATLGLIALTPWSILALSGLIGALTLPLNAMMRALWQRSLPSSDARASANVFESTMTEVVLLTSRLVVAVCALVLPIRLTVLGQALMIAVGTAGIALSGLVRADHPTPYSDRGSRRRGITVLRPLAVFFFLSASLGAFAFVLLLAARAAATAGAPLAIASWGAGSIVGLAVLRLDRLASARHIHGATLLTGAMGLVQLAVSLPDAHVGQLMAVGFVCGLPIAAVVNEIYAELDELIDAARRAEYFAWATTMLFVGDAFGTMVAGGVIDAGASMVGAASVATGFAMLSAVINAAPGRLRE